MQTIAITGASGFIGKHLVKVLARSDNFRVRVFSRNRQRDLTEENFPSDIEIIEGDLHDASSITELLTPGCTVINLAYLWNAGEVKNIEAINNLLLACQEAGGSRLIHCSTADLVGRARLNTVNENTTCYPVNEYGITKHKLEQQVVDGISKFGFDSAILRPTAVFGVEGVQLSKLVNDLRSGNPWLNYAKSCLFGERRMNLVDINNVVAAIIFLIQYPKWIGGEVFIVSDDDDPRNNFAYVEQFLMRELDIKGYGVRRLTLSPWVLSALLALRRRNNTNPFCNYDSGKLHALGYQRQRSLEEGLAEYAGWWRSTHTLQQGGQLDGVASTKCK